MKQSERRLEGRLLCADVVRVYWTGSGGDVRSVEAVLEDISPLGACIQVEEEIPLGATVLLSVGEQGLSGTASYCVWRDYGYFAGITFCDETHWSSGMFKPDHLTDLQALFAPSQG